MLVSVNLTFDHIEQGIAKSCETCPIALAILPHLAPGVTVHVMSDVEFGLGEEIGSAELPWEAIRFIQRFDHGKKTVPFSFDLDIPAQFLSAGYGVTCG